MFDLVKESRERSRLVDLDAISVKDTCLVLSVMARQKVGSRIEFAVGGRHVLAIKTSLDGYTLLKHSENNYHVYGPIIGRLLMSVERGLYTYHSQQGNWLIYKMED